MKEVKEEMKELTWGAYRDVFTNKDYWIGMYDGVKIGSILHGLWYFVKYQGTSLPACDTLEQAKESILNALLHDEPYITNLIAAKHPNP